LLAASDEDMKTVQSLLRHANPSITMGIHARREQEETRGAKPGVGNGFAARPKGIGRSGCRKFC
jgi:hypothetical protein